MSPLVFFVILGLIAWFWFDTFRVQEAAKVVGKEVCSQCHLQLLDETVTLIEMRIKRDSRGRWGLQRTYCFEFSDSGNNRKQGVILMRGVALEMLELPGYINRTISPV